MSLFDDEVMLTQKNLALVLKTPLDDDTLLIRHMTADEEMSRPFRFSLDMVSEDLEIDPKKVLGHPFSVKLEPIPKDEDNSLLGQAGALLGGGGDEEPRHPSRSCGSNWGENPRIPVIGPRLSWSAPSRQRSSMRRSIG